MRTFGLSLLFLFIAASALPHAGEVHTYMGTVAAVADDGSFTMKTKDAKELTIATSKDTTYKFASGKAAAFSDLAPGTRVVVTMAKDAKTATSIKLAPAKT